MKSCLRFFTLGVLLASAAVAQPLAPAAEARFVMASVGEHAFALAAYADDDSAARLTAFPNPTMGEVAVRFELERTQRATLEVFDLLGRPLERNDLGVLSAGEHEARVDLSMQQPGLYVIRLVGDAGARATVRVTRAMGA